MGRSLAATVGPKRKNLMKIDYQIIDYFRVRNNRISKIPIDVDPSSQFRRLLYITLLDGLSRIVFPIKSGNRERFCSFVLQFGQWGDGNRISITHLYRFLSLNPDPRFEALRNLSRGILNAWEDGDIPTIGGDPIIGELQKYWPNEKNSTEEWKEIRLETFQHINLLYELRNSLVHEFQVIGNTGYDDLKTVPFYLHVEKVISFDPDQTVGVWELFYPLSFLSNLTQAAINSLEEYLQKGDYDFSLILNDGSYWIKKLNA